MAAYSIITLTTGGGTTGQISLLRSADLSLEQIRRIIGTDPESALRQIEQGRSQSSGAAKPSKPSFIRHNSR